MLRVHGSRYGLKCERRLVEIETVGKIVRIRISIAERRQPEGLFDEIQNASEIVGDVGNIFRLSVGRYNNKRHSESVYVARSPARAIVHNLGWGNMIVPATPIVPG